MKYRYRIDAGRYGAEVVVGEVSQEFFDKFNEEEEDDLIEVLMEEEELERGWFDNDDKEHINAAYSDGEISIYSVPADGSDDWEGELALSFPATGQDQLYSREAFSIDEDFIDGDCVPIVSCCSSEKGSFGAWFIDTNKPFVQAKLVLGLLETDVGEFIDDVFYDKVQLECNYDYTDTMGKGFYARLGMMKPMWHDEKERYSTAHLKELFSEL
jgi:hypothetical protein